MEIAAIAFDADDTLWHSQVYFQAAQAEIDALIAPYVRPESVAETMRLAEVRDIPIYGYGVKAYIISLIDAAIITSKGTLPSDIICSIIEVARQLLTHPVELLPDVSDTLNSLSGLYKLALITKGAAVHQESKFSKSGIAHYFDIFDVVAAKSAASYTRLASLIGVEPRHILMVGNSIVSDVLPALEAGFYTAFIPYPQIWAHETAPIPTGHQRFVKLSAIGELPIYLSKNAHTGN